MKILTFSAIVFTFNLMICPPSKAEKVSISFTSFLPYSIQQVYLGEYAFTLTNINEVDMPIGRYQIHYITTRDSRKVSSNSHITVYKAKNQDKKIELSLILLPDESVIDYSNVIVNSPHELPEQKFRKIADKKFKDIQNTYIQRDRIQIILPSMDTNNVTEYEHNYSWLPSISAQRSPCTGTFKLHPHDALAYITSDTNKLSLRYKQKGKTKHADFELYENNNQIPIEQRLIKASTQLHDGIKFELMIKSIEKLHVTNHVEGIANYKMHVNVVMQTKNKKKFNLINRTMFFQEFCSFEDNSLLYYKPIKTRLWDSIFPDFQWR